MNEVCHDFPGESISSRPVCPVRVLNETDKLASRLWAGIPPADGSDQMRRTGRDRLAQVMMRCSDDLQPISTAICWPLG